MRYGIIVSGKVTEPTDIPASGQSNPIAWLTQYRFAGAWVLVSDDAVPGAIYNGGGSSTNPSPPPPPPSVPKVLTKTSFQDYAVSQLGGSTTGMARFTAIMDATRDSTSGAVRFAYARYEAAQTFEKSNTAALTTIMAADNTTGHLESEERTAILNNWPTG